jgi:hypothetical protein
MAHHQKITINTVLTLLIPMISVAVGIVPSVLQSPAQASEQELIGICENTPCVHSSDASQDGSNVTFKWKGEAEFYQVRYRSGSAEKQVKNTSGSFTLTNIKSSKSYLLKVQGCNSHFLAPSTCTAWMEIPFTTSDLEICRGGYVWRKATQYDGICVTPAVRTQTRNDNAAAASRREPKGGPYGPDTCKQGYVWREATYDDHVCVMPQVRAQAAEDNKRHGEGQIHLR